MKYLNTILLTLGLLGCSPSREVVQIFKGDPGKDGTSCSVSSVTEGEEVLGTLVSCTDGSSALIANGQAGAPGVAGANGENGNDGQDGESGAEGVAGQNGESCSAVRNSGANYVTISCPGATPVAVYDGTNGTTGTGCRLTLAEGPGQDKYYLTCGNTTILINNVKNNGGN